MKVTAQELELKIKFLNEWLQSPEHKNSWAYKAKEHNRNYYVNKLIELEETGQETIYI